MLISAEQSPLVVGVERHHPLEKVFLEHMIQECSPQRDCCYIREAIKVGPGQPDIAGLRQLLEEAF